MKNIMTETFDARPRAVAHNCAKLLIVDDEATNVHLLRDMLEHVGYHDIQSTSDPRETLSMVQTFCPDLILLDWMMPNMDGIAVMAQLHANDPGICAVPILMLTSDITPETKLRALNNGASDFLNKPFDIAELLLRIENLLHTRFLYLEMQLQNRTLDDRVRARTSELEAARQNIEDYMQQLEKAQEETLERLARAGEFRDDDTGQHNLRVGRTTAMLARGLGFTAERIRWIQQAARLHDVGKIGISDQILLKSAKLSNEETAQMKMHTTLGARLLEGGQSELMQLAQQIAQSHHERWDGTGYPEGLAGEEIPVEARILSVADVFDALTHDRPYKKAWLVADAVREIKKQSGHLFDPRVVNEFLRLPHKALV